jgi:hypothetical protein
MNSQQAGDIDKSRIKLPRWDPNGLEARSVARDEFRVKPSALGEVPPEPVFFERAVSEEFISRVYMMT